MTIVVTDRKYDPDNITVDSQLSTKTKMGRFLGSGGTSILAQLNTSDKQSLARQLYLQAEVVDLIESTPAFKNHSLVVTEPVLLRDYSLESSSSSPMSSDGLNSLKEQGKAIVYSLIDDWGQTNISINFELAEYLKDTIKYDKIILDYDTYDPLGVINVGVIVVFPEVDDDYDAYFSESVETWFNNLIMSNTDIFELEV